jgi:hypothetical protein
MINTLKETIMEIKDLRDSDTHQCPADLREVYGADVDGDCSCEKYDLVIDRLQNILSEIDSDSPTPEECIYLRNEIKKMEI